MNAARRIRGQHLRYLTSFRSTNRWTLDLKTVALAPRFSLSQSFAPVPHASFSTSNNDGNKSGNKVATEGGLVEYRDHLLEKSEDYDKVMMKHESLDLNNPDLKPQAISIKEPFKIPLTQKEEKSKKRVMICPCLNVIAPGQTIELKDQALTRNMENKLKMTKDELAVFLYREDKEEIYTVGVLAKLQRVGNVYTLTAKEKNSKVKLVELTDPLMSAVNTSLYGYGYIVKEKDNLPFGVTSTAECKGLSFAHEYKSLKSSMWREKLSPFKPSGNITLETLSRAIHFHLVDYGQVLFNLKGPLHIKYLDWMQSILEERDPITRCALLEGLHRFDYQFTRLFEQHRSNIIRRSQLNNEKYIEKEIASSIMKKHGGGGDKKLIKRAENLLKTINNKEVEDVVRDELARFKGMEKNNTEYTKLRNYVEHFVKLPWDTSDPVQWDVRVAKEVLDKTHFGLDDVKERIVEFIAVNKLKNSNKGGVILLHGPPGIGKTSIAKSVAKALGRKQYLLSVGGESYATKIKGHSRTYVDSQPGVFIRAMEKVGTKNPVIIIDEIDKMGHNTYGGDPASALLELLNLEENHRFIDSYLDFPFDFSNVLFICTANDVAHVLEPLMNRIECISLKPYVNHEKVEIGANYLIPKCLRETGLEPQDIAFTRKSLLTIIKNYCPPEAGVRQLSGLIQKVSRKRAVTKLLSESDERSDITHNHDVLKRFLGPIKRRDTEEERHELAAGLVNGLAVAGYEGVLLPIECSAYESENGDVKKTGNIQQTKAESIDLAVFLAKKRLTELKKKQGIDSDLSSSQESEDKDKDEKKNQIFFDNHKIHLHFPAGGIKKDGPSAGITVTTGLLSLASGVPVNKNLAFTGEITLDERVCAVGGIREKVTAAKNSGITRVVLPQQNKGDYEELPDLIKEGMTAYFVEKYQDVYNLAFGEEHEYTHIERMTTDSMPEYNYDQFIEVNLENLQSEDEEETEMREDDLNIDINGDDPLEDDTEAL
eukprot:CAMPEP_0115004744 /NCGR_PEP_ID=MMETSP0216-20121206/19436_1 /TAXON_ID=223996 /ORGANISM="Protocruzia adherens, Strain Boccale" /LENGTH=993 /DNA_ID=CAMNT_0002370893 /DNA_START=44 /DNA_END=3025 /DNA_ORIENTATION=+